MNHAFNIEVATEYSIETAILLENFSFWISKNIANKKNCHDGQYWTYNSQQALSKLFPYWKRQKIQRILSKMEDDGLIEKGNYNKLKYDKTTWYALTDKSFKLLGMAIAQNSTMEDAEIGNGLSRCEQPIPYIITDIKTDTKERVPFEEIKELFISTCTKLPKIKVLTDTRKKRLRKIYFEEAEQDILFFNILFESVAKSEFLNGKSERGWMADFDWILKPSNLIRILEGKFGDIRPRQASMYKDVTDERKHWKL